MACTVPEPVESFETWLRRLVAQAVEAGEVSVDLLTELQAAFKAALALRFAYYNFCRIHQTLRVTPAMAAGVTDRVWELGDLIG